MRRSVDEDECVGRRIRNRPLLAVAALVTSTCILFSGIHVLGDDQQANGRRTQETADSPLVFEGARAEIYKTVSDVRLYLYIFEPDSHTRSDRRPAAVFFFGGGWNGGSPKQFEPHCRYLASRGMVSMVADYRVKSRHGTSPFECVKDGKSAVRWIRANAVRLGVDANRVAAGGGSAGGHVAAAAGNVPGLEEGEEDPYLSSKPNALLLFNPVFDNGPNGYGYDRVKERYREISPLHNINKDSPPTIVFLGTNDALIPVSTARAYEQRMHSVGRRCDTHLYEGQHHGFFNKGRSGDRFYIATVSAMDEFLASLGWLDGQPTISTAE
jgi:acetyl esterase